MSVVAASAAIIPAITKLSNRVIRVLGCNPSPMTLQGTNTYLIGTGRDRILLDTGDANHPAYIDHLREVLQQERARISTILLTHWHHDHIGGCADVLRSIASGKPVGDTQVPSVWKHPRSDALDHYPDAIPDDIVLQPLHNEQQFRVDGATVRILYTPGHTTDHICVQLEEERVLFSGDCILGEGTTVFEDLYDYMRSLRAIAEQRPERIYPSHGNIIDDPMQKIAWYIEHRERREQQIWQAIVDGEQQRGWSAMDLVRLVYGSQVSEDLWPAAAVNVRHHLRKLSRDGKLQHAVEDGEDIWRRIVTEANIGNAKL